MSDEEKKAIVELNHFSNMTAYWKQEEYTNSEIDNYIKIVLNLIERINEILIWKQKHEEQLQKEIEELNKSDASKEQSSMNYYILYKELEDKIKAKIEELEKGNKNTFIRGEKILVLQSLLEKE